MSITPTGQTARTRLAQTAAQAAPAWDTYTRARHTLDTLWDQLLTAKTEQFMAQALRLLDHHATLRAAATEWDAHARDLRDREQLARRATSTGPVPTLATVARVDTTAWIYQVSGPDRDRPTGAPVERIITTQRERLRELSALTGLPGLAPRP
ncbi:hypothetical protein [Nocardiopsis sp. NPDC006938]|uniref:hypothetical protein n=1 Tax=Nocardiopsis sp. NPDC006938 TaxID=3364337 RepID=UPI00367E4349